jgi:DNA adenine methylase
MRGLSTGAVIAGGEPVSNALVAPFPYFGGKRHAARIVWDALDTDCDHYVEPFAGSLGVLLAEPARRDRVETVNDLDGYVVNVWRAIRSDPEAVAHYADWPVSELDLTARHLWLVNEGKPDAARLATDPDYCDPKAAGWWIWGACCWIGTNWCDGNGPWTVDRVLGTDGNAGRGVHRQLPHLGNAGQGVHRQLPHLGDAGRGVHRQRLDWLLDWFGALADRLDRVRVCCGDWARVVTPAVLFCTDRGKGCRVGVFLDPPYRTDTGRGAVYTHETDVAAEVAAWAFANGADPRLRIVMAGWDGDVVLPDGWRSVPWSRPRGSGMANQSGRDTQGRERLWLSPHCLTNDAMLPLFAMVAD